MATSSARATLIAYWNFNDITTPPTSLLVVSQGAGTLDVSEFEAGSVNTFTGTTLNAITPDPAGNDLALEGGSLNPTPVNNGKSIVFSISTVGLSDLAMTFAIKRSSTGFADSTGVPPSVDTVSYSSNGGGSYTTLTTFSITEVGSYVFRQFDFSSVAALNNNADVRIKITFDGATAQFGNNRIDNVQFIDDSTNVLTGACCLPTGGQCQQYILAACNTAGGTYNGPGSACSPTNPCQGAVNGACCNGATCTQELRGNCLAAGKIFLGEGISCTGACPPNYSGLIINEVRVDQTGDDDDEYFEIYNGSGSTRTLNGLTYLEIGDATVTPQPDNSGVIESVTELSGFSVAPGGHFLVARRPVIFDHVEVPVLNAVPNLVASFNFEPNSDSGAANDNITHLLVSGFYGTNGQDLDTPDNCVLDIPQPWAAVIDKIAMVKDTNIPPTTTECPYATTFGLDEIGPDGVFTPSHIFRIPDGATGFNAWQYVNEFDPLTSSDTPGQVNVYSTGACCSGTGCTIETRQVCVEAIAGSWKGRDVACGVGNVACQGACCYCSDTDPWCETWSCVVTDQETCTNPGGLYKGVFQGGQYASCTGVGSIDCTECLTITEARDRYYSTNPPVPIGVRICNVRLSSKTDLVGAGVMSFQIQDTSGADGQTAITIFGGDSLITALFGGVAEGDLIDVQGTFTIFNGIVELLNNNLRPLALVHNYGVAPAVPPAIVVPGSDFQDANPIAENRENEIVTLECVIFVNPTGNFAGATNYTVNAGTNNVLIRVATTSQDLVGTPVPTGICSITGIFSQFDTSDPRNGGYQLLPRTLADINTSPMNCGPKAACCLAGAACRADLTQSLCEGFGGNYLAGQATCPPTPPCLTVNDVRINEIRVEQPGTDFDEYFELRGTPTTPLGSLTYIVIGDGPSGGSGFIESVRSLTGKKIPADGYFLATSNTYTLGGSPDDQSNFLNFEDGDNTTHMIVENFTGTNGQDLDTPDDGVLNTMPWLRIVDSVAIVKKLNPNPSVDGNEYYYSTNIVGPAGTTSPSHVLRCPPSDAWVTGTEETSANFGNDTPGAANPNVCPCACPADRNADGNVNGLDIKNFANMLINIPPHGLNLIPDPCADINQDGVVDYFDTAPFVDLVLQGQGC